LNNLRLLARLYVRPVQALSQILDDGSLVFGVAAVLAVAFLSTLTVALPMYTRVLSDGQSATPRGMAAQMLGSLVTTSVFGTLFGLAALYVPACLLVATLLAPVGSFGVAFRRDYGSLLVCALFSWAAAHLPFALMGLGIGVVSGTSWSWTVGAWLAGALAFGVLMVLSLRTVFGLGFGTAAASAGLGVTAFALLPIAPLLASPFLLFWGWQYFRGDVSAIQWSFERRQGFKRHLQAATLNPRDSEAHYQLGLIYQQRRQLPEAMERFRKAVEIDPGEVDAHYQLGRIARSERRFPEAILHFEEVVRRDPKHSSHEVWREIGATYADSGDAEHARWSLEKYVAERPHDPEGLCRLGEALEATGELEAAREHWRRAIEAADTMPPFRRRQVAEWKKRAKRRLF
jgi:hypothetical protein